MIKLIGTFALIAAMLIFVVLWLLSSRRAYYQEEALKTLRTRCAELEQAVAKISSRELEVSKRESAVSSAEKSLAADRSAAHKELDRLSAQSGAIREKIASEARNCQMLQKKEKQLRSSIDALQIRQKELILSVNSLDKTQQALDQFISSNRNERQIGLDFERYVGFLYEQDGYMVCYSGANLGKEDRGIDLIATNGSTCLLIQCKRWKASAFVRENTVFQLYGSVAAYQKDRANFAVSGVLFATCPLSDEAIAYAKQLNIEVHESVPFAGPGSYPLIKCHNAPGGEKIYHLPMDQQYDTVGIDLASGDFYARTVAEAEAAGFRRAYRWHPTPQS